MTNKDSEKVSARLQHITEKVINSIKLYADYDSLDFTEKREIMRAIIELCEIVVKLQPDFSDEELFNFVADAVFTALSLKLPLTGQSPTTHLN